MKISVTDQKNRFRKVDGKFSLKIFMKQLSFDNSDISI